MFKKGMLEFGESIEEVFVNIANPFQYDPQVAETSVFKREIHDVHSAFHIMNYQKFYKATISNDQLRQAFLSIDGITDLIAKIVDAMYTGANYDEFQTMKYMLAKHILNGHMNPVTIPDINSSNMNSIVSTIKGVSNKFTFLDSKNNFARVMNHTPKQEQYLLVNSQFDATMDVEVLASAFNMDKAEFDGHRVLVDSFGDLDIERLNILFADDPTYTPITPEELQALDTIPCVLVDSDWFMVFDNYQNFTEQYNGEGLYWNYWYHVWKTFSVSPFSNNAVFVAGVPAVKSVRVTPTEATVSVGGQLQLNVTVATDNYAPQSVNWIIESTDAKASISRTGMLKVNSDAIAGTIKVKAISTFDSTKFGLATITVS
jgi:hypothetical protein